jgi:hypothetical protein
MQVSHALESETFAVLGGGKAQEFKIAANAHFFKILSDGLYQDKEGAVVRETICNAYDAHVMAGCLDRPIEITLTANALKIRDFGPGIPDDKIIPIYGTYGGSTKQLDKNQIGGFGLGCKSPFALTNHFMVTSFHAGFKRTYAMTFGNEDIGAVPGSQMMSCSATQETGLSVTIPISSPVQAAKFDRAVQRFIRRSGINVRLNDGEITKVRDYTGIEEAGFGMFRRIGDDPQYDQVMVLYGRVLYPLNRHEGLNDLFEELDRLGRTGLQLVLYAPPSSVSILPSREGLGYNEQTLHVINKIGMRAARMIKDATPKALKDRYLKLLEGARRSQFHKVGLNCDNRYDDPDHAEIGAFIGAAQCAGQIARVKLREQSIRESRKMRTLAGNFYRDGRKILINPPSDRWNARISAAREQYRYIMPKIIRAISDIDKPALFYRASVGHKMQRAGECHAYAMDEISLTIAPSRTAALVSEYDGFFLINKDVTAAQINKIKGLMNMWGFKVNQAFPSVRPTPRTKIVREKETENDKFTPFSFEGEIYDKKTRRTYCRPVPASLELPTAFLPVALTPKKVKVAPKKVEIGPMRPTIERLLKTVDERITAKFSGWGSDTTALPLSIEERDRLVALGVPRMCEKLIAELRKRIKPKNAEDAFTAYCALYADKHRYYGWGNGTLRFAATLANENRRLACAVYMQKYRTSNALDETYELWRTARKFFSLKVDAEEWLDPGEARLFADCKLQFDQVMKDFDTYQPKELMAFFVRMSKGKLTDDDVAHLSFIGKIASENVWSNLKNAEKDRFVKMIEDEGANFIAGKIPKQKAKLKLNEPPTTEEDDE